MTKYHMFSANGSLVTATKPETKYKFCTAVMSLFYIQQKTGLMFKICTLFKDLLPYNISGPPIKDTSITPTLEVTTATILVLLMVGN
jgi:hypothetical protein